MKKFFCILMIFLFQCIFISNSLYTEGLKKIILNKAVDKRALPSYNEKKMFKRAGYFTKENLVGAQFNMDGSIFFPMISDEPIDESVTECVYNALEFSGYEISSPSSNNKSISFEINNLFCQVAPGQNQTNFYLSFEVKLFLKSQDNTVLLEKTFYNNLLSTNYYYAYSKNVVSAFTNNLYDKLIVFFKSQVFLEAYNGRKKIFKEFIPEFYYNTLQNMGKIMKNATKVIPASVSLDVDSIFITQNLINDITSLSKYKNIYEVDFSSNFIKSIPKFQGLDSFEFLTLNANTIQSIQFLKEIDNISALENLAYLSLEGNNQVKKFDNISTLKQLKYLSLKSCNLKNIFNLEPMQNLYIINLAYNKLTKINNLNNSSLSVLYLTGNEIKKIENMDKLPNLTELDLSYNKIGKIENLEQLTNLKKLYLSGNLISKIENFNKLVKLEKLSIQGTKIKKIENLEDLVSLKELYVGVNPGITKIENIDNLINLKVLSLFDLPITKLEGINNLINLEKLNLGKTKISKLENIEALKNLKELNISETKIKSLKVIENFPNLTALDITKSKIDKLECLEKCPNLRRISAQDIQIDEITKASYEFLKNRDWKFYENLSLDDWIKKYFIKIVN